MSKPFPLLCKECKWSKPEANSDWNLRCTHPFVNSRDPWALSAGRGSGGTTAREERGKRSWFAACGMKGKLWETKR
jgi:hypothetical protein